VDSQVNQHKIQVEVIDTAQPVAGLVPNEKSAEPVKPSRKKFSRTSQGGKGAVAVATTAVGDMKMKAVVQDVVRTPKKESGSSVKSAKTKLKAPRPVRVLTGLPTNARDPYAKIGIPIFKTWSSEQANPWDIDDEDLDPIMPLLWSTATDGSWTSLDEVYQKTAKNIVSGVLTVLSFLLTYILILIMTAPTATP
jgi:hypothetical protein